MYGFSLFSTFVMHQFQAYLSWFAMFRRWQVYIVIRVSVTLSTLLSSKSLYWKTTR